MKTQEFPLWEGKIPALCPEAETPNRMTAFLHEEGTHPAVVIFPGGAYRMRADHEGAPVAAFYYENGYNAFVVDYRVEPNRHPAPLLDAQRAVKLVRYHSAEWHTDPEAVYTVGFSAGGHLCASVSTLADACTVVGDEADRMSARPNGAILAYPVISADPAIGHMGSFQALLGERFEAEKDSLSLERCVSADTCPCFLWHSMEDTGVPMENSLRFLEALRREGVVAEMHIFPWGGHGNGLAAGVSGASAWPALTLPFLQALRER